MSVEINLDSTNTNSGHIAVLQTAYEVHKTLADKQMKMLKDVEEDGPKEHHIASGWRTICTGKYDFSFLGLIITKRKS